MYTPPDVVFQPGLVVKEIFTDYKEFQRGAKNHLILNRYRLGSGPFYGVHSGIQLFNMQIGHADRYEGVINDGMPPKACVTVATVQKADGTVCVNRVPLGPGDVIIVDDQAPYRFSSSGRARLAIVSIRKTLFDTYGFPLSDILPAAFHDENGTFAALIDRFWSEAERWKPGEATPTRMEEMEKELMRGVGRILAAAPLPETVHGIGAAAAFDARDYLLEHLEDTHTVDALAAHFNISYRTLETSFRTLFGMTPKQLMDILRLNRAHEELCRSHAKETSVAAVAMYWGFKHLGRFASRHKAMFDTYPKEILSSESPDVSPM